MKWKTRSKTKPGKRRVVKRFLWLPCRPHEESEWRWLEFACIEQVCVAVSSWWDDDMGSITGREWSNVRWVDDTENNVSV